MERTVGMASSLSQSESQHELPFAWLQRILQPLLEINLNNPANTPPIMAINDKIQTPSAVSIFIYM